MLSLSFHEQHIKHLKLTQKRFPELDTEVEDKKETKRHKNKQTKKKQVDLLENGHDWAGISSSEHAGQTDRRTDSIMTAPCMGQTLQAQWQMIQFHLLLFTEKKRKVVKHMDSFSHMNNDKMKVETQDDRRLIWNTERAAEHF